MWSVIDVTPHSTATAGFQLVFGKVNFEQIFNFSGNFVANSCWFSAAPPLKDHMVCTPIPRIACILVPGKNRVMQKSH